MGKSRALRDSVRFLRNSESDARHPPAFRDGAGVEAPAAASVPRGLGDLGSHFWNFALFLRSSSSTGPCRLPSSRVSAQRFSRISKSTPDPWAVAQLRLAPGD